MSYRIKGFTLSVFLLGALAARASAQLAAPEPGPPNGGMRLRLTVTGNSDSTPSYHVKLDLINATSRPLTLHTAWMFDEETPGAARSAPSASSGSVLGGGFPAYLDAASSFETVPAIGPWIGQIAAGHRQAPQPTITLAPGDAASAEWRTSGSHLKNLMLNPLEDQDPHFPVAGVYAVHASIKIPTAEGAILLRSNEQLVGAGASRDVPRSTYGKVLEADPRHQRARIDLGSLQKIKAGDRFRSFNGMRVRDPWIITITQVDETTALGSVAPGELASPSSAAGAAAATAIEHYFPIPGESAHLILAR